MSMFRFVIKKNRLNEISQSLHRQVSDNAYQAATMAETDMKVKMNGSKHGRIYRRGKKGIHVASAPGEAPAVDYGHLEATIKSERGENFSTVSASAESAMSLEFGTAKMAPRPFFGPAVRAAGKWFFDKAKALKLI